MASRPPVRAKLLGPFVISLGGKKAGPWPRPTAKRLCELVLISPERRVGREVALEVIFPSRPAAAARAISTALSKPGQLCRRWAEAASLLQADRTSLGEPRLPARSRLGPPQGEVGPGYRREPGVERENLLRLALADESTLLEDEPYADWTVFPRKSWNGPGRKLASR